MDPHLEQEEQGHTGNQQAANSILDPAILQPFMRGMPPRATRALAPTCRAAAAAARRACAHIKVHDAPPGAIAHIALRFPGLTRLRLLCARNMQGVEAALRHTLPAITTLRELDLSDNYLLRQHELLALSSTLPALARLESLVLENCRIDAKARSPSRPRFRGCHGFRPWSFQRIRSEWKASSRSRQRWRRWAIC